MSLFMLFKSRIRTHSYFLTLIGRVFSHAVAAATDRICFTHLGRLWMAGGKLSMEFVFQ